MLRGGFLDEELKPRDKSPTAMPEELLRCWEEHTKDADGKDTVKRISLMYRRDVPQFRTPFFTRCMHLYNTWKLFKQAPPSGEGWANERNITCEILQTLEVESNKYDAWEREKEDNRRNASK